MHRCAVRAARPNFAGDVVESSSYLIIVFLHPRPHHHLHCSDLVFLTVLAIIITVVNINCTRSSNSNYKGNKRLIVNMSMMSMVMVNLNINKDHINISQIGREGGYGDVLHFIMDVFVLGSIPQCHGCHSRALSSF